MTWGSFLEYVIMRELGQQDAICRNYDLTFRREQERPGEIHTHIVSARLRMGFDATGWTFKAMLADMRQKLVNVGYKPPPDSRLHELINEWYVWDRIRKGDLKKWKYKTHNPIL